MAISARLTIVLALSSLLAVGAYITLGRNKALRATSPELKKSITNLKWTTCEGTGTKYITVNSVTVEGDITKGSTFTATMNGYVNNPFTHHATWYECK